MNYIKKLQNENKEKSVEICGYASIISDIRAYLNLPKFSYPNRWVNLDDVLRIIEQGLRNKDDLINDQIRMNKEDK